MLLTQIISCDENIVNINKKYNYFSLLCIFKKTKRDLLDSFYSPNTLLPLWIFKTMLEGIIFVHTWPSSIDTPCWLHMWYKNHVESPYTLDYLSFHARIHFKHQIVVILIQNKHREIYDIDRGRYQRLSSHFSFTI